MYTMPVPGVPQTPQRPRHLDAHPNETDETAEHDPTLLIAALEDLQSKRLAIDSLLDADLLCHCLS